MTGELIKRFYEVMGERAELKRGLMKNNDALIAVLSDMKEGQDDRGAQVLYLKAMLEASKTKDIIVLIDDADSDMSELLQRALHAKQDERTEKIKRHLTKERASDADGLKIEI